MVLDRPGPPVGDPDTTSGLMGWVDTSTGSGWIDITQLAGSTITMTGSESLIGICGLQEGLGDVFLSSAGIINVTAAGIGNFGIHGVIDNDTNSDADVSLSQSLGGSISVTGIESAGIYAYNRGTGATSADAAGSIVINGDRSDGIISYNDNTGATGPVTASLLGTGNVLVMSVGGRGLRSLNLGGGTTLAEVAGTIRTEGDGGSGVQLLQDNTTTASDQNVRITGNGNVTTTGAEALGVRADTNGVNLLTIDLLDNAAIRTSGANAHGVRAIAANNGGLISLNLGNAASISVTGSEAIGASLVGGGGATLVGMGGISATGEYGVGIRADSAAGDTNLNIAGTSIVTGGWQADIASVGLTTGLGSAGIVLGAANNANLNNAGHITAWSDRAILGTGGSAAIFNHGIVTGFVDLGGAASSTFTNAAGGLFDIRHFADTDGDGVRDTKRVSISNFGVPASSFDNQAGAVVRLAPVAGAPSVDNASYYVPTTGLASIALDGTYYDLARNGVVQGQFTNLGTFTNAGVIDLRGPTIGNTLVMTDNPLAGGPAGTGVFISEGGQLLLNSVLNAGVVAGGGSGSQSDVLVVDSTQLGAAATGISVVRREGAGALTPDNGILLVEVRNKAASAAGAFALNGDYVEAGQQRIVGGAYGYGLFHNGVAGDSLDGNWYLRNVGLSPNTPIYQDTPEIVRPVVELPTLQQRVGNRFWRQNAPQAEPETVYCKNPATNFRCALTREQESYYISEDGTLVETNGYWARLTGLQGHYTPRSASVGSGYDLAQFGLQAGVDHLLSETGQGSLVGGVSAQFGHVFGTSGTGSLSAQGFGLGTSLTYYDRNGFYMDGQAGALLYGGTYSSTLMGRLAHDVTGLGYSFSLEAGQRLALDDKWALTPQVQLSYSNIGLNSFTDRLGTVVSIEEAQSLKAHFGLAAEYRDSWKADDGSTSHLKMHGGVNFFNEFLGNNRVNVSGVALESRKEPQWIGVSLGGTYNWADDKYSLYGEVGAATSFANFGQSHELKGSLGLRVHW